MQSVHCGRGCCAHFAAQILTSLGIAGNGEQHDRQKMQILALLVRAFTLVGKSAVLMLLTHLTLHLMCNGRPVSQAL